MAHTIENGTGLVPSLPAIIRWTDAEGKYIDIPKMNIKRISPILHDSPLPADYSPNRTGDNTQTRVARVVIELVDDDNIEIKLTDVTNQPGWTIDLAGVQQAVDDISSWLSDIIGTSGSAILTSIYNEIKDDTDDEYVLYYDQVADAWYYGMWSTDDGGNPTVSYFDTDGTPAVPANPVEPVKGKIHMAEVARWEALISGGADKEWTEGDILSERLITFLPEGAAPVNLSRAWYNTGGPTVIPEWSTFASYTNQMPKRYFRVLGGDHTWIPTVSLYYERTGGALVIQPGVPIPYGGDGWITVFDCCRVLIEILDDGGSPFYYSRTGLFNVASFAKESKAATGDIIELVGQRQMIGFAFYQYAAVTQKFKVTLYQA